MSSVLIRRSGTLIDVSPDGRSPLAPEIVNLLRPLMQYEHRTLLRGAARYSADGMQHNMDIELRNMFTLEEGRLTTAFGFLTTIVNTLSRAGISAGYVDISPPRARPRCYEVDWENAAKYITFRPGQLECLQYITRNETGIINAAPGFGKTHLMEALCHLYPRAKFHIVVRPVDVARRICKQLSATLPNIGVIGGGKNYFGDRITVFTAGSVHKTDGDCDFLLCDEAHLLMTGKTAIGLGEGWRFARNFGFTATPGGRMDGAHAMLECFFGREIFKLSYADAAALGLVVPIHVRWLPMDFGGYNPARDKVGVPQMRWGIWRNDIRNQKIAEDVKTTYPSDKQILILVATIDHAVHLWQHLQDFSLVYGSLDDESIAQYKRNRMLPENFEPTTPERREQMRQAFEDGTLRRVIATDVWSTGVDFAKLQVIYRCDARSSEVLDTQAPGRVSRIHPASGKQVGEVIDCADMFDASLHRKAQVRKRHYAALGWTQDWPLRERSL